MDIFKEISSKDELLDDLESSELEFEALKSELDKAIGVSGSDSVKICGRIDKTYSEESSSTLDTT